MPRLLLSLLCISFLGPALADPLDWTTWRYDNEYSTGLPSKPPRKGYALLLDAHEDKGFTMERLTALSSMQIIGLLLVPEGSSGCIYSFAIQGSMAFAPK